MSRFSTTPSISLESKARAFSSFSKMPDEVEHEPRRSCLPVLILVGAVDAGDGLEQHVVAHRLVQVHAVQDRGVEAGQQLLGHDQDLRQLVRLAERFPDALLLVVGEVVAGKFVASR